MDESELCWCGSGKSQAECHAKRGAEAPIPSNALRKRARREGNHRLCMHFSASKHTCSGGVINAHTVQRSRELRQLMDSEQHVLTFDPTELDANGLSNLARMGWRDASTFAGFCKEHDRTAFAPVETRAFDGGVEQCLLLAYRSICYEVHRKRSVTRSNSSIQPLIDRGYPEWAQRQVQAMHRIADEGNTAGLEHFESMKALMDATLRAGDPEKWCSTILWFSGPLSLATSGVVSPNRDLDGVELQRWTERMKEQESMCFNIVAVEEGGAAVLTWPANARAPRRFLERILKDREPLLSLLVQYLFRHVHNIYFSQSWWTSLRPAQKVFLRGLASLTNPEAYFGHLDFRPRTSVVPWVLQRITSHTGSMPD